MLSQSKNIFFIIPSRYPTEKAYGVTTEYTALALKNLGHNVTIICSYKEKNQNTDLPIFAINSLIIRLLTSKRIIKFKRFRFLFFLVIFAFRIRIILPKSNNIIWCRDIMLAMMLSVFTKNQIVCEIHRVPSLFERILLLFLNNKTNVLLCPITNKLKSKLNLKGPRCTTAPMAVNSSELELLKNSRKYKQKIISYIGHIHQVGNFLDTNLINNAATLINRNHPEWRINIIGITVDEFQKNLTSKLANNLDFYGQITRQEVLKALNISRIGLLIYPDSKWFKDNFPIKIVEYAAGGLGIVASDTESHRAILGEDLCVYFKPDSHYNLADAVIKLIENSEFLDFISINSQNWAQNFTYEMRAKKIIDLCK